jgi:hypothetical protein
VLALTRPAYQKLVEEAPAIVEAVLAALARRFAKETARIAPFPASPKARTVALIDGGLEPLPGAFDRRMREGLAATHAEIVDAARLDTMFPGRTLDAHDVTEWLNKLEHTAPLVVYLAGRDASPWARKAIRQADMVVFACRGDAPAAALTEIEAFACRCPGRRGHLEHRRVATCACAALRGREGRRRAGERWWARGSGSRHETRCCRARWACTRPGTTRRASGLQLLIRGELAAAPR